VPFDSSFIVHLSRQIALILGLGTWLPGHHNEPIDGIHVFAIAEGRVFGDIDLGKQYPFDVKIVILGVTLGVCTSPFSNISRL